MASIRGDKAASHFRAEEANAHLIAAAPDLLEALRRARDSIADMFAGMQFHPDHKDIEAPLLVALSNARAAITKAEGRAE